MIMPYLTARGERATLRVGSNVLGGREGDAVSISALAGMPPAAVLVVRPDALSVVRRLDAKALIRVDGVAVGADPVELRHGTRIDVGNCQLTYGHPAPLRAAPGADAAAAGTELITSVRAENSRYHLVDAASGETMEIPEAGGVLGRERGSDVVIDGKGVSRRHATIKLTERGYLLTDHSSNGMHVNGVRLSAAHALRDGDVITIGARQFRWEAAERPRPLPGPDDATQVLSSVRPRRRAPVAKPVARPAPAVERVAGRTPELSQRVTEDKRKREALESPATLATLSNGLFWRTEFRIVRPVASIGRAEHNDVRIIDESVSGSHATLIRKGSDWFVVDSGSSNGTFVDGYRVSGERILPAGATLMLGNVKLTFRPRQAKSGNGTRHLRRVGLFARLARLWEIGRAGR